MALYIYTHAIEQYRDKMKQKIDKLNSNCHLFEYLAVCKRLEKLSKHKM